MKTLLPFEWFRSDAIVRNWVVLTVAVGISCFPVVSALANDHNGGGHGGEGHMAGDGHGGGGGGHGGGGHAGGHIGGRIGCVSTDFFLNSRKIGCFDGNQMHFELSLHVH